MRILGKIGKIYRRLLCKHPIVVQAIQTGILMGVGDVIAQKVVEQKCDFDYLRTARFFSLGMVAVGPAMTIWYKCLSRIVGDSGKFVGVKKMALDQLLFAPAFLCFFIIALNVMANKDWDTTKRELCDKYQDILISNYKLWPATQLFNFSVTPLAYQVLFVQVVALVWNVYLSWKTQQAIKED